MVSQPDSPGEPDKAGEQPQQPEAEIKEVTPSAEVKTVPESQLKALQSKMQGEIKELKKNFDSAQQTIVSLESEKTALEERLTNSESDKARIAELEKEIESKATELTTLAEKSIGQRKAALAELYGIGVETLQDKTSEQLDALEEALKIVAAPKANRFAIVSPGGGNVPETPIERANRTIEEARRAGHYGNKGGSATFKDTSKD